MPKLTRAVELALSQQELDAQPNLTSVVVRTTVDTFGYPRNLTVAQSAGATVDKQALLAVSQYRFKPAMRDDKAVEAPVLISIKIQKN